MSFAVSINGPSAVAGIGLVKPYVILETKMLNGATVQWLGTFPISAFKVPR
jgi:hypothetical protein